MHFNASHVSLKTITINVFKILKISHKLNVVDWMWYSILRFTLLYNIKYYSGVFFSLCQSIVYILTKNFVRFLHTIVNSRKFNLHFEKICIKNLYLIYKKLHKWLDLIGENIVLCVLVDVGVTPALRRRRERAERQRSFIREQQEATANMRASLGHTDDQESEYLPYHHQIFYINNFLLFSQKHNLFYF